MLDVVVYSDSAEIRVGKKQKKQLAKKKSTKPVFL